MRKIVLRVATGDGLSVYCMGVGSGALVVGCTCGVSCSCVMASGGVSCVIGAGGGGNVLSTCGVGLFAGGCEFWD